jgi:hypothetical protein
VVWPNLVEFGGIWRWFANYRNLHKLKNVKTRNLAEFGDDLQFGGICENQKMTKNLIFFNLAVVWRKLAEIGGDLQICKT